MVGEKQHRPGWDSLAYEVLMEAKKQGATDAELEHSLWAEYLRWYQALRIKELSVVKQRY